MFDSHVSTVTGPLPLNDLGVTLMHEHVIVSFPGWEADTLRPGPKKRDLIAAAVDKIQAMQDFGIQSMLDPCPNDLGRDVELSAEISARTGFNIICATGLYNEHVGGHAYWKLARTFGIGVEAMAELFIHELTEGIGKSGIKPGVIKVATSEGKITEYEYDVLTAAALASTETGAPITTHTEQATMGKEQQEFLIKNGVPGHKIIIGHSCGTSDHDYHMHILENNSYLGFDRFGANMLAPDEQRVEALTALLLKGLEKRIIVSHDCVWCSRGQVITWSSLPEKGILIEPTHFHQRIIPQLLERGVTKSQIDTILTDNPRRYFSGEN